MLIEVIAQLIRMQKIMLVVSQVSYMLIVILAALILDKPARLVVLATVLSVLIAMFSAYLLLLYAVRHPGGWDATKELVGRTYFVVPVPLFAVRYFIASARRRRANQQ